jgi:YebC/PmpR family DNA-binding regulatory protein
MPFTRAGDLHIMWAPEVETMAGHSHWARIKRAKAVTDARRGRAWSKLARAITVAARAGGDPDANLALRSAIEAAKAENMPKETIERAIRKGTGELEAESIEEIVYEGYGPGGAALLVSVLTDNRNRTAGEIRKLFERHDASLGASGSVAWLFQKRGLFVIPATAADEDTLTSIALEHGADDLKTTGGAFELSCDPSVFEPMRRALAAAGIAAESAEVTMVPVSSVTVTGEKARLLLTLIENLEDHDDVQKVYCNYEIPEEEMARLAR